MDKYIGAKLIQAEPERNPVTKEITGYKVVYPDGYESWSPKDVFEKAYMKVNDNKNLPSGVSIGPEMVDDFIASTETITMGETTTVVRCVLRNGLISWNHLRVLIQRITMKRSAKIFAWEVSKTRSGNC